MTATPFMQSESQHAKKNILLQPSENRQKLTHKGLKPQLHKLDNEISQLMTTYMENEQMKYELTPTGLHRHNLAERAIQTLKNHFISGLCSTHPDFPLNRKMHITSI